MKNIYKVLLFSLLALLLAAPCSAAYEIIGKDVPPYGSHEEFMVGGITFSDPHREFDMKAGDLIDDAFEDLLERRELNVIYITQDDRYAVQVGYTIDGFIVTDVVCVEGGDLSEIKDNITGPSVILLEESSEPYITSNPDIFNHEYLWVKGRSDKVIISPPSDAESIKGFNFDYSNIIIENIGFDGKDLPLADSDRGFWTITGSDFFGHKVRFENMDYKNPVIKIMGKDDGTVAENIVFDILDIHLSGPGESHNLFHFSNTDQFYLRNLNGYPNDYITPNGVNYFATWTYSICFENVKPDSSHYFVQSDFRPDVTVKLTDDNVIPGKFIEVFNTENYRYALINEEYVYFYDDYDKVKSLTDDETSCFDIIDGYCIISPDFDASLDKQLAGIKTNSDLGLLPAENIKIVSESGEIEDFDISDLDSNTKVNIVALNNPVWNPEADVKFIPLTGGIELPKNNQITLYYFDFSSPLEWTFSDAKNIIENFGTANSGYNKFLKENPSDNSGPDTPDLPVHYPAHSSVGSGTGSGKIIGQEEPVPMSYEKSLDPVTSAYLGIILLFPLSFTAFAYRRKEDNDN